MTNYSNLISQYGLNEVKEQKEFLTTPEFINPDKPVVLAGGTGFGKTFTAILKLIMFYSDDNNKDKQIIILPSSTKVLRNNFGNSLSFFNNLPFTYCIANGKREFKNAVKAGCNVIIVLPQTLAGIEELPKVEWLVVDEAHKWYFAETIGKIIDKTNPTYQLLLTGTPFKFNARKDDYLFYYVPVEDMIEQGLVGNPLIEVVSSSINLKKEDFSNDNGDTRRDLNWSYKENKNQLVQVATEVHKTLKTRYRNYSIGRLLGVFGIDKTIIYCYSKNQARHFYKAFQSSDLKNKVLISNSVDDIDSAEFEKFKVQEQYRVLLVVDRGREGFDMPELFNIVDFTLSNNPEVILQILGRVLRLSKEQPNKQKVYYKVASMNTAPFVLTLMTGVLQLIKREYYSTFTGKFDELKVPMMPEKRKKRETTSNNRSKNGFSTRALRYFQDVNIPLTANFWNQLKFKQGDIWKTMGQTTLRQVLSEMGGRKGKDFLTKEYYDYVIDTYKVTTYNQLFKINSSLAQRASSEGWDVNLEKNDKKNRNVDYSIKAVTDFILNNKIQKYNDFTNYENGQSYKKHYKQYFALGLMEELVKKGKPGLKEGHTYSEADKKKMSKARKKAWANPNKYQNRKDNFTLNTK